MGVETTNKIYFSREEMFELNKNKLLSRGVTIESIAEITYNQQSKYNDNVDMTVCIESVEKILSFREIFHLVQLSIDIDMLVEKGVFSEPIQSIMQSDLGMFGIDELFGLSIASLYGTIGQTNFGDIDVNKPGIVKELNDKGKADKPECHTFLDDVVGALAAAASTRVAQVMSDGTAKK